MINNVYLGSNGKCYGSIAEMEKDTGVGMGYYLYTGIANYITPQNHISQPIISNYSGVPYAYNGLVAGSGCWMTTAIPSSGGIWWDGKCGVQGHGKHSSDVIKKIPQTGPKKCDCKIMDLMTYGCRCKGI